jgi:hypothetical protein
MQKKTSKYGESLQFQTPVFIVNDSDKMYTHLRDSACVGYLSILVFFFNIE